MTCSTCIRSQPVPRLTERIMATGKRIFDVPRRNSIREPLAAGFSLLEMMIVITIILILAGIAAGQYQKSVLRSREATLKQDLSVMRQAIQQYTLDKQT